MVGKLAQDEPAAFVSIRPIKEWAATRLAADSTLRKVLEREEDTIRADEFVGKIGTWLAILGEEPGFGERPARNSAPRQASATKTPKPELKDDRGSEGTADRTDQQGGAREETQVRDRHYSLTAKGKEIVGFKPPQGRRGGGPLHIRMMKVLYYFYLKKGWYTVIDQGDEPQREPDLLVWELNWQVRRLEDGTITRTVDPEKWKMPPFHVEAETTPRKSKSQVIMNYEKAWALKRYVVFGVPSKQDADDLKKIMDEIGAPSGSYEIDDISDLLAEDLAHPESAGPMEVAP